MFGVLHPTRVGQKDTMLALSIITVNLLGFTCLDLLAQVYIKSV
jgi:hypothetical protein